MSEATSAFHNNNHNSASPEDGIPVEQIQRLFLAAIAQNRPVAIWRQPYQQEVQLCISLQEQTIIGQPELESSPTGFFFCPFQQSDQHQNHFIKADLYYNAATGTMGAAEDAPADAFEEWHEALQQEHTDKKYHIADKEQAVSVTEEAFKRTVSEGIAKIKAEQMEKVVPSRSLVVKLPSGFSALAAFHSMRQAYPRAFVSLVSIPEAGTWLGATPEILVSINKESVFKTVALAGTQPAAEGATVGDAIWRQKEIEEQAMVERYILNCFKQLRLREYTEVGPRTIIAGNLMHLRTDFTVDLKEVDSPELGSQMLELLHPTSAVCGLPKEPSKAFLKKHEGYNRSYYSGYLGPVNYEAETSLYVNLRCMQLLEHEAILYAGAGVTSESDPDKEWQETQHKMQTMQRVLESF